MHLAFAVLLLALLSSMWMGWVAALFLALSPGTFWLATQPRAELIAATGIVAAWILWPGTRAGAILTLALLGGPAWMHWTSQPHNTGLIPYWGVFLVPWALWSLKQKPGRFLVLAALAASLPALLYRETALLWLPLPLVALAAAFALQDSGWLSPVLPELRLSMRFDVRSGVAVLVGAVVFGVSVYRAATLAITTDEAFTFEQFVIPTLAQAFSVYDANNHILHTFLCRVSVALAGPSELALRLPALLGTLLYLFAVWKVTGRLIESGIGRLAAFTCMVAIPVVMDYFWVARGYSLALGLFLWGVNCLLKQPRRLRGAALLFALSIAANLVFLIPVSATGATLLLASLWNRSATRWVELTERLALPVVTLVAATYIQPFLSRGTGAFYYGAMSFRESLLSLSYVTGADAAGRLLAYLLPAAFALALLLLLLLRRPEALVLALTVAAPSAAFFLFKVPLPLGRTGIYIPPLIFLALALGLDQWLQQWRAVRSAVFSMLWIAGLALLSRPEMSYHPEWRWDAGNREIAARLSANLKPGETAAAEWPLPPGLNYYAHRATVPFDVRRIEEAPGARYLVLWPEHCTDPRATILYRDPVSGVCLTALPNAVQLH